MRIACLAHKNPKQVGRLIKNIYSSSDFFYVDVFGNNFIKEHWKQELQEFEGDNFFIVNKYAKAWGTFQLVNATLDAMNKFARSDYDYFLNLSGQCYPLKSIDSIKKFLQGKNLAYMEFFKLPYEGWGERGVWMGSSIACSGDPLFRLRRDVVENIQFIKI